MSTHAANSRNRTTKGRIEMEYHDSDKWPRSCPASFGCRCFKPPKRPSAISEKAVRELSQDSKQETATMNFRSWFETTAPAATSLVRLLVGLVVFFPEGIQKL